MTLKHKWWTALSPQTMAATTSLMILLPLLASAAAPPRSSARAIAGFAPFAPAPATPMYHTTAAPHRRPFLFSGASSLSATPQQRPMPRRALRKRPNRRRRRLSPGSDEAENARRSRGSRNADGNEDEQLFWETRPLVRSAAKEAGEDYWIDEDEFKQWEERSRALRNRKALEGEISQEKLRTEVVAPYKQNWIGFFSVFIVIISTIVTKFPELLQSPVIEIPDL